VLKHLHLFFYNKGVVAGGVRIAELDELAYRKLLWDHKPITDFWRVGGGIAYWL
jgi:hypothetical protein